PLYSFIMFDSLSTQVNAGSTVDNLYWSLDSSSNPLFYIFNYNGPDIPGQTGKTFGFDFIFDSNNTSGVSRMDLVVIPGSGKENDPANNGDNATLQFFIN